MSKDLYNNLEEKDWQEPEEYANDFEDSKEIFSKIKILSLKIFTSVIFFILLARVFQLQILGAEKYKKEAQENYVRYQPIEPLRGLIYDRNRQQLTENIPTFKLIFMPSLLHYYQEREDLMKKLSDLEIEDTEKIFQTFYRASNEPIVLKNNLDYESFLDYSNKIRDLPGMIITASARRHYLWSNLISHVLGYNGKISQKEYQEKKEQGYLFNDIIGKEGIEAYYEEYLRGEQGFKLIEVDSQGREIKVLSAQNPQKGKDLILALDLELQKKAHQVLKEAILKNQVSKGVFIALNPKNGEVLSMISLPDFDNELIAKGISVKDYQKLAEDKFKPLFNRAISGTYPPGSTIKPLIGISALEEKILKPNQLLDCRKDLIYYGFGGSRWVFGGLKAYGMIDIQKALAISCNTFFYVLGGGHPDYPIQQGLGIEKMKEYADKFNLDKTIGIDLPGEVPSFFPDKEWKEAVKGEQWYIGDTYHISIGQGDMQITPIALATYINTIASNGIFYAPHLLKQIQDGDNLEEYQPEIIRQDFVSPANLSIIRQGMRDVITEGSGRKLADLPFTSAGKTGTAECAGCADERTHAWFVGFAPYENPEITFLVLLENGGESYETAVPVAKEVLEWYFNKR